MTRARTRRGGGTGRRLLLPLLAVPLLAIVAGHHGADQHHASPPAGHDNTTTVAALRQLAALRVLPTRPHHAGYTRAQFGPAWTDATTAPGGRNGCDSRDDILRAQLTAVQFRPGSRCVVTAGVLHDPYTGRTIAFTKQHATAVQVDHLVPLALAWDLGANTWPATRRAAYANDEHLVLLAVDGPANQTKADHGPAEWLPANRAYHARYAARFIAVLTAYHLPITAADKTALTAVLKGH